MTRKTGILSVVLFKCFIKTRGSLYIIKTYSFVASNVSSNVNNKVDVLGGIVYLERRSCENKVKEHLKERERRSSKRLTESFVSLTGWRVFEKDNQGGFSVHNSVKYEKTIL